MKCFLKRDLFFSPCRLSWGLAKFLCWVTGVGWGCSWAARHVIVSVSHSRDLDNGTFITSFLEGAETFYGCLEAHTVCSSVYKPQRYGQFPAQLLEAELWFYIQSWLCAHLLQEVSRDRGSHACSKAMFSSLWASAFNRCLLLAWVLQVWLFWFCRFSSITAETCFPPFGGKRRYESGFPGKSICCTVIGESVAEKLFLEEN